MLNFSAIEAPDGWFYSPTFDYWQKTTGRIVCYVTRTLSGYQVQLYLRGDISICKLEVRTPTFNKEGYLKMFEFGESWLTRYADGNMKQIRQDRYAVDNLYGVWGLNASKEEYWVSPDKAVD